MKDSYPRTGILPFVLLGVVLFGLALAPPGWWNELTSGILADTRASAPSRPGQPPIVIFERQAPRPRAFITATMVKSDPPTPATSGDTPQATDPAQRPTVRSQSEADESRRSVWQPPVGWVPRPIQPLRIAPEPPVAKQFREQDKYDSRSLDFLPKRDPSAVDIENVLSHSEQTDKPAELQGIDTDPADDEFAELPLLGPAVEEDALHQNGLVADDENAAVPTWPEASQLHGLLTAGADDPLLRPWIFEIRRILDELEGTPVTGQPVQLRYVDRLHQLGSLKTNTHGWSAQQIRLYRRIHYALRRRTDVWRPLLRIAPLDTLSAVRDAREDLAQSAQQLSVLLARGEAKDWIRFLNLPQLENAGADADVFSARRLAEQTLRQLHAKNLTAEQQAFLRHREFQNLEQQLRSLIAASISPADVLHALEVYEDEPNHAHSAQVIGCLQRLRSGSKAYDTAIDVITSHYRNANVRISLSEDLLNRFVPAFHQYAERVNDTILGAAVRGQNSTSTALAVRLVPDRHSIRLGLMANGHVDSNTASRKGPVTMFNNAKSTFTAGKQLIVHPHGVFVSQTETRATTGHRLVGLQTELDNLPILGWIVRYVAERQQNEQRPLLRAEILRRVKRSASQRIDREVHQRLATVEQNINARVMQPLNSMSLDPKAIEMRTTKDRAILRSRLASPLQFGAHTPRPQARADSKMSLHIHQTALNNLIEQMKLHGRRLTIEELFLELSDKLGVQLQLPNDEHQDTIVQFADLHPLEFLFDAGQISLTIHVAELNSGKRTWKNFSARGYYRADVDKLDVELVRDEGIELISDQLGLGDQIALRGIFTKVLAKNTRFEVLRKAITDQPKLQDLVVTQFTIRDGWIAVAMGEQASGFHVAEKASGPRR